MELKPGIGIDNLIFGMLEPEVMELIGDPDRTFINEDDENEVIYQYNSLKMRLSFYRQHERKLGYIRCGNNQVTYNNELLTGMLIKKATEGVLQAFEPWQIDSYEFFDVYMQEANGILLNVEYEAIADVELSVITDKDGVCKWPERL